MATVEHPSERVATRKSVPLTAADVADLELIRSSPEHRQALSSRAAVQIGPETSEAALLHALLRAGRIALRHEVELQGYADMAAEMDAETKRRSARRRQPTWADE